MIPLSDQPEHVRKRVVDEEAPPSYRRVHPRRVKPAERPADDPPGVRRKAAVRNIVGGLASRASESFEPQYLQVDAGVGGRDRVGDVQ